MEVITLNKDNLDYWRKKATKNVIALGFFDGVHRGHCEVIATALQIAKDKKCALSVMSFFPHPKTVISNGKKRFDYIMPVSEKAKVLQKLGVDRFYVVEFDKAFASMSPKSYVSKYILDFYTIHAVAGYDFTYGYRGKGNINRLRYDANNLIEVTKVDKVEHQGRKISSTWIRELLSEGNVEELPPILGRDYETVGKWDGNSLNILPYYTLPATGRYIVSIKTKNDMLLSEIIVDKEKREVLLMSHGDIILHPEENISLIWRKRVTNNMEYTYNTF